jgi:hypothetical protein
VTGLSIGTLGTPATGKTIDWIRGIDSYVDASGAGTVSNMVGLWLGANGLFDTVTITNFYGAYLNGPAVNGGTPTTVNAYGVYVKDFAGLATTLNYPFFYEGGFKVNAAGAVTASDFIPTANYKSVDGTVGATVTTCSAFKNGLCVSGS